MSVVNEESPDGRDSGSTVIFGPQIYRSIWPDTRLFGELLSTDRGGVAFSVGAQLLRSYRFPVDLHEDRPGELIRLDCGGLAEKTDRGGARPRSTESEPICPASRRPACFQLFPASVER